MKLTDTDLAKIFPYGASLLDIDNDEAVPLRGLLEPHDENPDWMNLWVTEGMNSVLTRNVQPDGTGYLLPHWDRPHRLTPLTADQKVVF